MTTNKLYSSITFLAVLGIILALYLLFEQLFRPSFQPCNINTTINCNAVVSGAVAKTFGIPTPIYGLVGYIVILLCAVTEQKKLLLATAFLGLAFCMAIAYEELFQLHVICPVCIACQLIMIVIVTMAFILNKNKPSQSI